MANRSQRRRARRAAPDPQGGRHPLTGKAVAELSAAELHRQLVSDAVGGVATPVWWFAAACERIGERDRIGAEAAYRRVREEVRALGGIMPDAPGA